MNTSQLTETELDSVSGGRVSRGSDSGMHMMNVQSTVSEQSMNDQLASRLMHTMQDSILGMVNKIR
jgi:bacteriocin-like protein